MGTQEKMGNANWEMFESIINNGILSELDHGPLHHPIYEFFIKRDEDLELIIETKCNVNAQNNAPNYPPGTIRENLDYIKFKLASGYTVYAKGINSFSTTKFHSHVQNENYLTELAQVHEITCTKDEPSSAHYLIEWLANTSNQGYIWPDQLETIYETRVSKKFRKNSAFTTFSKIKEKKHSGVGCIYMTVGGHDLCFGYANQTRINEKKMPGFIMYAGNPTKELRKKIRLSISFIFGRPLIYLGETVFDEEWNITSLIAKSPDTNGGLFFKIPPMLPPALLNNRCSYNIIESSVFSQQINAIYNGFEKYNFKHISSLYWHAISASPNTAAGHFGALIEAIQESYKNQHPSAFNNKLLKNWGKFKDGIHKLIDDLTDVDLVNGKEEINNTKKILKNRISNINSSTQQTLISQLMKDLELNFSAQESKAWSQRINDAHGKEIEDDKFNEKIREIKILKTLCHRMLLRIMRVSDSYIDYYTPGYPVRKLEDSVA